ncbi:hypothetical protein GH714_021670 [Hevea brasiliensis]|uniref:Endoplasmic reticulum vesicle transporter C-terminal domain-containing protein n=1 Tax=Hevea brasiliensis TaxID=3981 RepID=A0A6A6MXS8_HEVBR|nr:hypothetical protein GH714_021670 [Hevea brasiliensis]
MFKNLEKLKFDVTFPAIPCTLLSIDAKDIMGEEHFDMLKSLCKSMVADLNTMKFIVAHAMVRRNDDDCCNSCEQVREAYKKKGWALTGTHLIDQCMGKEFFQRVIDEEGEGCNIYGSLEVNKVAGNFHFVPGKSLHHSNVHVKDLLSVKSYSYNISHRINRLAFGDYFPGVVNPLDGVHWEHETPNGIHQYFLKAVPTIYTDISGHTVSSNQYSVTEHFKKSEPDQPDSLGVFFFYDFSPIKVTFKESISHFYTS